MTFQVLIYIHMLPFRNGTSQPANSYDLNSFSAKEQRRDEPLYSVISPHGYAEPPKLPPSRVPYYQEIESDETRKAEYEEPYTKVVDYEQPRTEVADYEQPRTEVADYEQPRTEVADYEQPRTEAADYEQPRDSLNYVQPVIHSNKNAKNEDITEQHNNGEFFCQHIQSTK